jgi:hypothetical protein
MADDKVSGAMDPDVGVGAPPGVAVADGPDVGPAPKRYELTYKHNSKYELTIEGKIVATFFTGSSVVVDERVVRHHEFTNARDNFAIREVD